MFEPNADFYAWAQDAIRGVRSAATVLISEIRNNKDFKLLLPLAEYIEKRIKTVNEHSINSLVLRVNFVRELKDKMAAHEDLSSQLVESNIKGFKSFFGQGFYNLLVELSANLNCRNFADDKIQHRDDIPMRTFGSQ